jgi:Ca2+-binding RTX toxin-like protein
LTLNIGPNAGARLQGNTSDGNETIYAKTTGDGTVVVWSPMFNVDEFSATTNPFTGVKKIVAYGGAGNDVIDLSGVTHNAQGESEPIVVEVYGGDGNDQIWGGAGNDLLYGDDGDDIIYGGPGADIIYGGRGDDELYGEANPVIPDPLPEGKTKEDYMDRLYGGEGNDRLDGGPGDDYLDGGPGDDEIIASLGNDIYALGSAGSIDFIGGGSGNPILDFSGKAQPVTVFVKDGKIVAGFGEQYVPTATILSTEFNFNSMASLEDNLKFNIGGTPTLAFDSIVGLDDATDVERIIGSSEPDKFHVQGTADTLLVLDGGVGADRYYFYADPDGSAQRINVKVDDIGENLKDENIIEVIGSNSGRRDHRHQTAITTLNATRQPGGPVRGALR